MWTEGVPFQEKELEKYFLKAPPTAFLKETTASFKGKPGSKKSTTTAPPPPNECSV